MSRRLWCRVVEGVQPSRVGAGECQIGNAGSLVGATYRLYEHKHTYDIAQRTT